jgi:hypothetical protein
MGQQWGGNAKELVAIARYHKGRYFADAKLTMGIRGLDFNTAADTYNYGGNIYLAIMKTVLLIRELKWGKEIKPVY